MKRLALGAGVSAALAYFFDPQSGARRRNVTRDRVLAFFRRRGREAERAGRGAAAQAYGLGQKAMHLREEPKDFNDPTLVRKVETELFRDPDVPKGQIDVSARDGIVELRGEVAEQRMIDELVSKARSIEGVRDVENLLHLPGTEAPMHQ